MAEAAVYSTLEHTASDGYRWRYRRYLPEGRPKAEVVCLHGIQSHAGWYDFSCRQLQQAGYAVSFLDRRGSGMNQEQRGDTPGFRRLTDDVAEYLQELKRQNPTLKTFVVAISWGGKLAVALEWRHPGLMDGLALLCPGFYPRVQPPLGSRLAILWARLLAPRKLFPIPLSDPELFTATPRWLQFLREDPLALHKATARLLVSSVQLDVVCRRRAYRGVRVPVLLLLAGRDRIIDNARARGYVERFPSPDREVIEYPDAHHTLEFEPDPERFVSDLVGWLDRHCPV